MTTKIAKNVKSFSNTMENMIKNVSTIDQLYGKYEAISDELTDYAIDNLKQALDFAVTFHRSIPKDRVPNARVDEIIRNFENKINSRKLNTCSYNKPIKKWLTKEEKNAKFWEFMDTNGNGNQGVTRKQLQEFFNLGWSSIKDTVQQAVDEGKISQEKADFNDGRGVQPYIYKKI